MKVRWITGPMQTAFGELRPEVEYDLPEGAARDFIGLKFAEPVTQVRTYPARTGGKAIHKAETKEQGSVEGDN